MQVEYYLVSAARRTHRLKPGRPYVFGREDGVDIVVSDALASRRHAEVRWRDKPEEGWDFVDLNSRNGISVNGQRVDKQRKLEDSDQLQIGGQIFRFHMLPPGGDPNSLGNQAPQISNIETMGPGVNMADLAAQGAAFTGMLSDGLIVMLQFLQGTHKTGRLDLLSPTPKGSVWVEKGAPVHAVTGTIDGVDAIVELAVKPPPRFAFHADAEPPEKSIEGSANGILMEVARLMDEAKK